MKAVIFTQYGSAEGLRLAELPKPIPKADEVLVRMRASSINSWDWEALNGTPFVNRMMLGLLRPKPEKQVLGADVAGTVEAVGRSSSRFRPGDEVFGDLWDRFGAFAEYVCTPETSLEIKPANVTFEQAAAVPQAGVLALQGLRKGGEFERGHKVLINGAGGGVGTFAIQLAKLRGAEVTGVDAPHKLDLIRSLGADHVIDYHEQDFTKTGNRYDLIVDCQNVRSMRDNKRALNPGGTFAMIGGTRIVPLLLMSWWSSLTNEGRKYRLVMDGPNKGLTYLKDLIEAGDLRSVIDSNYDLSEVPSAMRYFGEGRHKGKIAISVKHGSDAGVSIH